ncbi:MAG TPA: hypothetical protein VGB77_00660, partial [Abditibacteriaceae bacterium]
GTSSDVGSGVSSVLVALSRPTSTGSFEYWLKRSGVFGWGTTSGDLLPTSLTANGTWSVSTNLPSGANLGHGQYYVSATAVDRAGNRFVSQPNTFRVGAATADNVRVDSPANGASIHTLPAIEGRAVDAQGVAHVTIELSRRTPGGEIQIWGNRNGVFGWATSQPTQGFLAVLAAPTATETRFRKSDNLPSGSNLAPGTYFVTARMFDNQNDNVSSAVNTFTVIAVSAYTGNYNVFYTVTYYSGYSGVSDSGEFVLTVGTDGAASGTLQSEVFGTVTLTGSVNSSGVVFARLHSNNNMNDDTFTGDLDSVATTSPKKGSGIFRDDGINNDGPGEGQTTGTWTSTKQ